MVWDPGHWEWRGNRHVWVDGRWLKERPGYRYREARWVERGGRWEMRPGGWERDDRRDNRRGGGRGDRDGDGVPNRYDDRPNNPHRH